MKEKEVMRAIIYALIGAAVVLLLVGILSNTNRQPARNTCNNGWSTQVENGVVYRTYLPAEDTCNR